VQPDQPVCAELRSSEQGVLKAASASPAERVDLPIAPERARADDPFIIRPAGVRRSSTYFRELESLRGIAITLVFLYHSYFTFLHNGGGLLVGTRGMLVSPVSAFVIAGHTGVSLFFVLSAFLLSLPFLAEAAGGKRVVRSEYFARRALRILPLYWAAVVFASVACAERWSDVLRGVPYLVFVNSFGGVTAPLPPYYGVWWSLATEAQFYLLLPLIPLFLRSRRGRWLGGVFLLGYGAAYLAYFRHRLGVESLNVQITLGLSIFGRAPLFAFGILAAWVYRRYGDAIRARCEQTAWLRSGGADLLFLGIWVMLGYLLRRTVFIGYWDVEGRWHIWHVIEGGLWTAIVLVLLLCPLRAKAIFSNRILAWVGVVSYSVYMVHQSLIRLVEKGLRLPQLMAVPGLHSVLGPVFVAAALSLMTSALTYRVIERPFLVRKARLDR